MAIRYDKKINKEINRIIKNFNQKISRLEKEGRELLPEKITKQDIKESVHTRSQLKQKLKELKSFSKRGAEDVITTSGGVNISKYELENLKKQTAVVKAKLTREINRLKVERPKVFGKMQDVSFAEMGDVDFLNLQARRKALEKNVNLLNLGDLGRFKSILKKTKESQELPPEIFKGRYLEMLTDLGYYYNYDADKLNEIKRAMLNLDDNKFLKLFKSDKAIRSILDYYPVVTQNFTGIKKNAINPADIREDVEDLYDNLYENLESILKDYA